MSEWSTCPYCDTDIETDGPCAHVFCQGDDLRTTELAEAAQCGDLVEHIMELTDEDTDFLDYAASGFVDTNLSDLSDIDWSNNSWTGMMISGVYTIIWSDNPTKLADEIRKIMQRKYVEALQTRS